MNDLRHSFPGQEADEVVYILTRPHPFSFIGEFLIFLFLEIFSLTGQYLVFAQRMGVITDILVIMLGFFSMFVAMVYFVALIDNYYDISIVTNDRLITIDQEQLFYRKVSELVLTDVQDVSSTVKGFFPTLFDYGDVEIQTAGEKVNFLMSKVAHPREVAMILTDLSDQAEHNVARRKRIPKRNIAGIIDGQIINKDENPVKKGLISLSDYDRLLGKLDDLDATL